jgi:hypothetical protein
MSHTKTIRAIALTAAGAFALGITGAAAQAPYSEFTGNIGVDPDDVSVTFTLSGYLLTLENKEFFQGIDSATNDLISKGVSGPDLIGPVTVSLQTIESTAGGISVVNSLADASPDVTTGDAILSAQVIPDSQAIATVSNSRIGADLTDFFLGTVSVDLNVVSTRMTINNVSNGLGLPSSSSNSPTSGSAAGGYDGTAITSVIENAFNSVNSIQQVIDSGPAVGSVSAITDTDIGLEIDEASVGDIAAIMSASNNQMGATYTANAASNGASKTTGSFVGSVIVSNGQLSAKLIGGPDTTQYSAAVLDSSIGGDLPELLGGDLTVSGNTISAWSTGNNAMNQIGFTDVHVTGEGASGDGGTSFIADTGTTFDTALTADLGVASAQGNLNEVLQSIIGYSVDDTTKVQVGGTVSGGFEAGGLVVSANNIGTQVYGNESSNSITQSGSVFDATAVIGGYQTNDNTYLSSVVRGVEVGALLGGLGVDSVVSSKGNTIAASLTGNSSTSLISIASVDMTALNDSGLAALYLDPTGYGSIGQSSELPTTAGALITNLQSNYGAGTSLSSLVTGSYAAAWLTGDVTGGSDIDIGSNGLEATTTGNTTINEVQFAGDSLLDVPIGTADVSAGIGNLQFNDVPISATVSNSYAGVFVGGTVAGLRVLDVLEDSATVGANGNTFMATAEGNATNNLVSLYVHNLTAGGDSLATANVDLNTNVVTTGGGAVVGNVQVNTTGPIEAIISDSYAGVEVAGGEITDAIISAEKNTFSATATGNSALSNQVGSIGTKGTLSAAVASQQVTEVEVTAALNGVQVSLGVGRVEDSVVSLLNNTMMTQAIANTANNTLGAIGYTSLSVGADESTYQGSVSIDTGAGLVSAEAATAVVNSQVFTQDVSATIGAGAVLTEGSQMVIDAADIIRGTVALNGDQMQASATGNTVFNTLGLNGVTLGTGAEDAVADLYGAVANYQLNDNANVAATVTGHEIGLGFAAASDLSTLVVQQSGASATAQGSYADNKILLSGTTHVATSPDDAGPDAYSFIILSDQVQQGSDQEILASVTDLDVGMRGTSAAASSLVVSSNVVTATATNNTVLQSLEIAFESLTTSAKEETSQTAAAPVNATIDNVNIGIELSGAATDSILSATSNVLQTQATGNSSNNEIDVAALQIKPGSNASMAQDFLLQATQENSGAINASVKNSGIGAELGGLFSGPAAAADSNIVSATGTGNSAINALKVASYADSGLDVQLNNTQTNTGSVTGMVQNQFIALNVGGSAVGSMSVSGNQVSASAYGNSGNNTLVVTTLPSSAVFGGMTNTQTNIGNVTAAISGLNIGITTGAAGTLAAATVSRNTVSAYAVGNSAVNIITRYNTGSAF